MDFFAFDKNYLDRLRSGDPTTEHHFFTYFERLFNIKLRARGLGSDEVEDLRQEALIRTLDALRKEGGIRQPERFGAFLNSTCNNVLLEFFRSSAKKTPLEDAPTGTSDKAQGQEDLMTDLPTTNEEQTQITPPPGATLYSIANSICSKKTMEEIVSPSWRTFNLSIVRPSALDGDTRPRGSACAVAGRFSWRSELVAFLKCSSDRSCAGVRAESLIDSGQPPIR